MKFITLVAALVAAIPVALAALTINTPSSVVECQPTLLDWSGGTAPYYLTFVPAGQTSAPAIKQFPTQNGNSYTWNVDLQAGTSFTIALKDSSGASAYSDIVTVQAGSSNSCDNLSVQETGTGGSGPAPTGTSGSSATGTTASKSSSNSGSASTATSTASKGSSSSAAGRLGVSSALGVAGVMGLVGAALF